LYNDISIDDYKNPLEANPSLSVIYGELVDDGSKSGIIRLICEKGIENDNNQNLTIAVPICCLVKLIELKEAKKC